jgi:tRNA-2-methylthio-N6-dimethylallyladenosine synthase
MEDQLPREAMDERLQRLQALLGEQQLAFNRSSVGRRTDILVERDGKRAGQRIGKSPWLQSVHVETAAAIGDLIEVEIISAGPNSLAAVMPAKAGIPASEKCRRISPPGAPAFAGATS